VDCTGSVANPIELLGEGGLLFLEIPVTPVIKRETPGEYGRHRGCSADTLRIAIREQNAVFTKFLDPRNIAIAAIGRNVVPERISNEKKDIRSCHCRHLWVGKLNVFTFLKKSPRLYKAKREPMLWTTPSHQN
jgi:hypothetical protein